MPLVIREIVSEVVLEGGRPPAGAGAAEGGDGARVDVDDIVRRAAERVLETLRREWER